MVFSVDKTHLGATAQGQILLSCYLCACILCWPVADLNYLPILKLLLAFNHWLSLFKIISNPFILLFQYSRSCFSGLSQRFCSSLDTKLVETQSLSLQSDVTCCMHAWANGALESGGGQPCQHSDAKLITWVWYHTDAAIPFPRHELVNWHSVMPCRQTSLGMC